MGYKYNKFNKKKTDHVIITTKPSVVEHIGYKSSVQSVEDYDHSIDFNDKV